jgi:peroxiredoxin
MMTLFVAGTSGAVCATKGTPAVDSSLQNLDGQTVKVSDYRGKVVIMSFWATWCQRCEEQLAYLQELSGSLSDDVIILAVNQDSEAIDPEEMDEIRAQVEEAGLPFPVLVDAELEMWGDYCINALPTNVILDREGRVAYAEPNFYWDSKNQLSTALGELGAMP